MCGAAAVVATGITLAITHLPAPSAVDEGSRDAVRGVWHGLGDAGRAVGAWTPGFLEPLASDKTIHFAIFLLPVGLWAGWLALGKRLTPWTAGGLLAASAVWAAVDEATQQLGGRVPDWGDWLANVAGAGAGIAGVGLLMALLAGCPPSRGA
jgi:hypothetical protein